MASFARTGRSEPSRPTTLDELRAESDVVLYDRQQDSAEMHNLATDRANDELLARYSALLEELITAEIGTDARACVTERPRLLGWPIWHGDVDQPAEAGGPVRRVVKGVINGEGTA